MKGRFSRGIVKSSMAGLLIVAGLCASTLLAGRYSYRPSLHDSLYLPSGRFLGEISLGYKQLTADLVWLSAVQYYGEYRQESHDLSYFEGLIDIVSTLDPHFIFAYVFGALVVCEDIRAFDKGIAILKRGMQHNPTSWELPFEIGFLNYVDAGNPDLAARYFALASRMPGGPDLARRFAAFVYSKAGRGATSIRMWEELRATTEEPYMKELADRYIEKLKREMGGSEHGGGIECE